MKKFIVEIVTIGTCLFFISYFFIQVCFVKGPSMKPTLNNNDILLIQKFNLDIKKNDIILFKKGDKIIIKRVVATGGDTVLIKNNLVYVNNKIFDEINTKYAGIAKKEIKLGKNEFFVLGDNRGHSIDSRFSKVGIVKKNEIIGKKCL